MKVIECVQGSDQWKQARCGKVTASRIGDVMAKKTTARYIDYVTEKAIETLTGVPYENGYMNKEMERGKEQEPFARAEYEVRENVIVDQVGFVIHPTMELFGCSPDGLIGDDWLLEIKNPKSSTHLRTITENEIDPDYIKQIQGQLACTERQMCVFLSYDNRLPDYLQYVKIGIPRDDKMIAEIEKSVNDFLGDVFEMVTKLSRLKPII